MRQKRNMEVIIYHIGKEKVSLEADFYNDTIWATHQQIAELFGIDRSGVSKHIGNILKNKEISKRSNVQKMHIVNADRPVTFYSLDMILAVGYRANSIKAVKFRKCASLILKQYLINGYTINKERLKQLNKTIEIISRSKNLEISGVANVLKKFTSGLDLLDNYDYQSLKKPKGTKNNWILTYEEAKNVIYSMKFNEKSSLFGNEKDESFKSTIVTIYQTFGKKELYPTIQEKAANLLYLVVKNHSFSDGNKRIAAALFVYFLEKNGVLRLKNGFFVIDNSTLAAMTLMIALSKPAEKEIMILLVMNFLEQKNG